MMTAVLFNFSFSWPISFGSSSAPKPPSNKTIYGLVQRLGPGQIKNLCTNIKIGKKFLLLLLLLLLLLHGTKKCCQLLL